MLATRPYGFERVHKHRKEAADTTAHAAMLSSHAEIVCICINVISGHHCMAVDCMRCSTEQTLMQLRMMPFQDWPYGEMSATLPAKTVQYWVAVRVVSSCIPV